MRNDPHAERIIGELFTLATDVRCNRNYRLMACIARRGRIISYGSNSLKSHPLQFKYGRVPDCIFLHAEIAAIKNALRVVEVDDLKNCTMYIARAKYDGSRRRKSIMGIAKPCEGCMRAILEFGIKRVYYSTNDSTVEGFICDGENKN